MTPRNISLIVLILVIGVIGFLSYRVMYAFLLPLFLAALLTVIFRPAHNWILARCKGRHSLAAGLTTAAILMSVLLPLAGVLTLAAFEANDILHTVSFEQEKLDTQMSQLRDKFQLERPFDEQLQEIDNDFAKIEAALADENPVLPNIPADMADHVQALGDEIESAVRQFRDRGDPTGNDLLGWKRSNLAIVRRLASQSAVPGKSSDLEAIRVTLEAIQSHIREMEEATTAGSSQALRRTFAEAETAYSKMQTRLMGGPIWAYLIRLASPNETELSTWMVNAQEWLKSWLPSITGRATALMARMLVGLAVMVLALYYFLADGPALIRHAMRLFPLDDRYERELLNEFESVSRAVVLATLLSAIAQGLLGGIGYFFAGVPNVFLLTMLTCVLAMVPFVGAGAVWVPAALWLGIVDQRVTAAIILAIYGFGVVSMVDNLIKPLILHGQSRLHPLLALLSVLGGVQALGPIGIVVGPMVVSFLQALLNMLHGELADLEKNASTRETVR